ncbi:hypothetical protein AFLA_001956 [Aspergillus flavus NRRL3357]|nr:hypothetical protein AFLA_001956 [Aspergillus flavus NRRL3357]
MKKIDIGYNVSPKSTHSSITELIRTHEKGLSMNDAVEEAIRLVVGSSHSLPFLRTVINTSRCTALKACKIHTSAFYNRSELPFLDFENIISRIFTSN